jgi:hypothetical protein
VGGWKRLEVWVAVSGSVRKRQGLFSQELRARQLGRTQAAAKLALIGKGKAKRAQCRNSLMIPVGFAGRPERKPRNVHYAIYFRKIFQTLRAWRSR